MTDVLVIGGGIVGASVAYHLGRRDDASVTLLERAGTLGSATTGASSLGLRDYGADETQTGMKRYGRQLYNEFLTESGELIYEPTEVLHVATTPAGRETVAETAASEHPASSPSRIVDGASLREVVMLPDFDETSVEAALYRPNAGYFRSPAALVHAFADRATAVGATIATDTEVTDFVHEDGRVAGVIADGERYAADAVVCAVGPWNDDLATKAGVEVPVRQQRLHVVELEPTASLARQLPKLRHVESGVTFRGRPDGRVLAYHATSAADPYEAAESVDPDAADAVPEAVKLEMLEAAEALVPALADAEVAAEAVAYTSRTPDGNPIVGWTDVPGFSIAALHSRGVQYAPAIGDVLTQQLVDDEPTSYYRDVTIDRFDGFSDHRGPAGAAPGDGR